jgi:hypothetical protein
MLRQSLPLLGYYPRSLRAAVEVVDGRTTSLWDSFWNEKQGHGEQSRNILHAQPAGAPMVGFTVVQR